MNSKNPSIENSCYHSNFIDEEEQSKAELQLKETINFITGLFTEQELKRLAIDNKSFKELLEEHAKDKYPSMALNEDIEEHIKELKNKYLNSNNSTKEDLSKLFLNTIVEDIFIGKNTFIFNKKMEIETKEFLKNPLRLQSESVGYQILFAINFLGKKVDKKISELFDIPTKYDRITMEEQLFIRYRAMFYRFKLRTANSEIKKFIKNENNKAWFETIKQKNRLDSINKQKLFIIFDYMFFPEDIFNHEKGKIRKFLLDDILVDWNIEKNKLSIGYKIQKYISIFSIFMIIIVGSITVSIYLIGYLG